MRDFIHDAIKWIDHNRYTVIGAAALAGLLALGGCSQFDGKVVSSQTGELLDRDELRGEFVEASQAIESRYAEALAQARQAQAELEQIQTQAEDTEADFAADLEAIDDEIAARGELFGAVTDAITQAGVTAPWLGPLTGIGGLIFGGGVFADNRRKDKKILEEKAKKGDKTG